MSASIGFIGEYCDLRIRQGADFGPITETLTNPDGSPVDLTDCICRGHIRRSASSPEIAAELYFSIPDPALGVVIWGLTSAQTAALEAGDTLRDTASRYVYDMEIEDATGHIIPWRYGSALVHREVTR